MESASQISNPTGTLVERVYQRAFVGAIHSVENALQRGPAGRLPQPHLIALHQWYEHLPSDDQRRIQTVIREAVRAAVFGCMVVLDNTFGGYALPETLSDFAVYLQTYPDDKAMAENRAGSAVRLNPVNTEAPDLHDQLLDLIKREDDIGG